MDFDKILGLDQDEVDQIMETDPSVVPTLAVLDFDKILGLDQDKVDQIIETGPSVVPTDPIDVDKILGLNENEMDQVMETNPFVVPTVDIDIVPVNCVGPADTPEWVRPLTAFMLGMIVGHWVLQLLYMKFFHFVAVKKNDQLKKINVKIWKENNAFQKKIPEDEKVFLVNEFEK